MLLSIALSLIALSPAQEAPAAAPAPRFVVARTAAVTPRPSSLAQRLAEVRRDSAPPLNSTFEALRERQRLEALFPARPSDSLGSAARRLALGQQPLRVASDGRLGSAARRAALSSPVLPRQRRR